MRAIQPYHPSDAINEMLLKVSSVLGLFSHLIINIGQLNPSARVAITSDNDWISVLQKVDP